MRRALAIGAALALGLAIGLLGASGGSEPAPVADPAAASREVAGVPVGYPRSREGAILAAARYQQAFANPSILRAGTLRRRVEAVATPDFAAAMLAANRPGAARLARGPLGKGVRRDIPTLYTGVPVGYRVLSYSPRRARVLIWGFTLLGNASAVEPAAYFGLSRTELAWQAGDWKIAATSASFGPTPRLASPRRSGEGFELLDLAQRLRRYGIAP